MKIKKYRIILVVALSIFIVLIAAFLISPYSTIFLKSKSQFIQLASNSNIYFEPGAKVYADSIASYLPGALERVRQVHGLPFEGSFKIYICNTQKSFNEYTANSSVSAYPIRGTALLGDVIIAPGAFNFIGIDTHRETLTHELSHLHFQQRLGFIKRRKLPAWFSEGFADYVAGSGGEGIGESEAITFILNGKHFIPEEEGEIFGSLHKAFKGLSGPMFHKQVKMFVTYIIESDSLKFKSFLYNIQMGESFSETFNNIMDSGIQNKWTLFIAQLKAEIKS